MIATTDHAAEAVTPSPLPQPRVLRWKRSTHPSWPIVGILRWGPHRWQQSRVHAEDESMLKKHARMNSATAIEIGEDEDL
jgi:hypothetical protein